jgi:ferredoxin
MACMITRLYIDCLDTGCVSICPIDCIYGYTGVDRESFPNQLYIDSEECIDCGACEPECPWGAIFQEAAVPEVLKADIASNRAIRDCHSAFRVARYEPRPFLTREQIAANKRKWGVDQTLTSARMARRI